jgi:hypothetical protein
VLCIGFADAADRIALDTSDPMFFEAAKDFVSRTDVWGGNEVFQIGQRFSYGVNDILALSVDARYQESFHSDADGLSNVGLMVTYRAGRDKYLTDVFGGINFGGAATVPNYADTVYAMGARIGRQWEGMTLAAAAQNTWIRDETRGMSHLNIMGDAYFRFRNDWAAGLGADFRVSTDPNWDQQWVRLIGLKQYGRTQYIGRFAYEFEESEWRLGAGLNIIF